jgi:predicted nucleic acid-binding protein
VQVVYDVGALIAIERRDHDMTLLHQRVVAEGAVPLVPTIVLGRVWRGIPREAALARVLKTCRMHVLDVITAKLGGQLCGVAETTDLADAVVAVLALRYDAAIVTSDPGDLQRLGAAAGRKLEIFTV